MSIPVLIDCDPGIDDAGRAAAGLRQPGAAAARGEHGGRQRSRCRTPPATPAGCSRWPAGTTCRWPPAPTARWSAARPGRAEHVHGDDGVHRAVLPEPTAGLDPRPAVDLLADRHPGLGRAGHAGRHRPADQRRPAVRGASGCRRRPGPGGRHGWLGHRRQRVRGGRVQRLGRPGGGVPGADRARPGPAGADHDGRPGPDLTVPLEESDLARAGRRRPGRAGRGGGDAAAGGGAAAGRHRDRGPAGARRGRGGRGAAAGPAADPGPASVTVDTSTGPARGATVVGAAPDGPLAGRGDRRRRPGRWSTSSCAAWPTTVREARGAVRVKPLCPNEQTSPRLFAQMTICIRLGLRASREVEG